MKLGPLQSEFDQAFANHLFTASSHIEYLIVPPQYLKTTNLLNILCYRYFEHIFLTKVKLWRNWFNFYIHGCCNDTLCQELKNLHDAKHKTKIIE